MEIQIKSILGSLLFEGDFSCLSDAVTAAVKAKANLGFANLRSANLSSADLSSADLRFANLRSANLSSADLSSANLGFANLSFANLGSADLRFADLRFANLGSADLSSADLRFANLSSANLSSADLSSADLGCANLGFANLRLANLSLAKNLPKIQVVPIRQMVLKAIQTSGNNLNMSDWHTCETTHCDAGWIVTLHPEGKLLESIFDTSGAAALILNACGSPIPSFTADNDEAMAHIIEQAGLERERMGALEELMPSA